MNIEDKEMNILEVSSEDINKAYHIIDCLINKGYTNVKVKDVTEDSEQKLAMLYDTVKRRKLGKKLSDKLIFADYMISPLIEYLNERDIETVYSCDGHFEKYMYIDIKGFLNFKCIESNFDSRIMGFDYWRNSIGINMTKVSLRLKNCTRTCDKFHRIAIFYKMFEKMTEIDFIEPNQDTIRNFEIYKNVYSHFKPTFFFEENEDVLKFLNSKIDLIKGLLYTDDYKGEYKKVIKSINIIKSNCIIKSKDYSLDYIIMNELITYVINIVKKDIKEYPSDLIFAVDNIKLNL